MRPITRRSRRSSIARKKEERLIRKRLRKSNMRPLKNMKTREKLPKRHMDKTRRKHKTKIRKSERKHSYAMIKISSCSENASTRTSKTIMRRVKLSKLD